MSSIGTFGSFTQARLGIYAAQKGMSVTGQNITNINTPGYTRQRLDQSSYYASGSDRYYASNDAKVGYGVMVNGVSQLRDPYLDIRFRGHISDVGAMGQKLDKLGGIQSILDEVGKGKDDFGVLGAQFSEIYKQLQQMVDQTGDSHSDIQVRVACESLVKMFRSYASKLEELKQNSEKEFAADVKDVNTILTQIRDLNDSIRQSEIHGDPALELRDERNMLIDRLSEYVKIDVRYTTEDLGGGQTVEKLVISLGDANPDTSVHSDSAVLIDGIYAAQLSQEYPKLNPNYDPKQDLGATLANGEKNFPYIGPELNPNYDPKNPAAGRYLDQNGAPTNKVEDARRVPTNKYDEADKSKDPNLRLTVTDLRNKEGALLYNTQKQTQTITQDLYTGKSFTKTDAITGVITIVTQTREPGLGPMRNPAGNPPYLKAKENPAFDPAQPVGPGNLPYLAAKRNPAYDPSMPAGAGNERYLDNQDRPTDVIGNAEEVPTSNPDLAITEPTADRDEALREVIYQQQVYTKTPSTHVALDDNDLHGSLQALREFITDEGEFSDLDVIAGVDENAASKRGIGYYQKALDLLANQFATQMNQANHGWMHNEKGEYLDRNGDIVDTTTYKPPVRCDKDGNVDPKGKYYQQTGGKDPISISEYDKIMNAVPQMKLNNAGGLVGCDKDGNPVAAGQETHYVKTDGTLIAKADYDALVQAKNDAYNGLQRGAEEPIKGENYPTADQEAYLAAQGVEHAGVNLFSTRGDLDSANGITAANISISKSWSKGPAIVSSFVKPSQLDQVASTDSSNLLHMVGLFTTKMDYDPTVMAPGAEGTPMFNGTFQEMWDNIGAVLGNDIRVTDTLLSSYESNALDVDMQRTSVSSVDLNDEAMNLMQYSKSYNAACRLMTTLDNMLDKLINGTGATI